MPVICEKRNHVGWLTLSRPEADSLPEILFAPVVLSLLRGDRGFESLYPLTRLLAGRHCRLAGPGWPAGSRPRIPVF